MAENKWKKFVPRHERQILEEETIPEKGRKIECLLTDYQGKMIVFHGEIQPGGGVSEEEINSHEGEEFVFIIDGELEYILDNEVYQLKAGDILCFSSIISHRYYNKGNTVAKVLWGEIEES